MFVELLLVSALGASAAGIAYLRHHSIKEKKANEKRRQEEEAQFRLSLLHEVGRPRFKTFRLSEFSAKCEIPKDVADRVAEEIYSSLYRSVIADCVVSAKEREKLDWLAGGLEIDAARIGRIEKRVKEGKYEQAVNGVLADGQITPEEAAQLEQTRRLIGISKAEAFQLTKDASESAYRATFRRLVHDGVITPEEQQELLRAKQALALSDEQAGDIIRGDARIFYAQYFLAVIQDGIVTPDEEKRLAWLQEWSGLRDADVAPYHLRMQEVKRLASYRKGNLPSVRTGIILEGGEICHWDHPCILAYETRTRAIRVSGELVVTSKNVYFISDTKNLSYRPSRILDIVRRSNGLEIKVNSRQGSGRYLVSEPAELEAILVGVVSKHKFLLSESYSSARTRHIPDDVKREVWDRDAGRCTRCRATEYLEFDHIIPHTRGGANTVNNVQLLCRKCNLIKSDRI
jgi:HNH endonuclease